MGDHKIKLRYSIDNKSDSLKILQEIISKIDGSLEETYVSSVEKIFECYDSNWK